MNKTRYSATEFGRNKPMNFRPSGTLRFCMEMIQNVSNCHKSERSRNKNDLPFFIVVLVII